MIIIGYLILAVIVMGFSIQLSNYVDIIDKRTSISGAFIGGVLLGVIENLSKAYISSQLSDAIVFSVLIIVLLVRPTGILGKKIMEKV